MKIMAMLVSNDELAEGAEKSDTNETHDLFSFMKDDDTISYQELNIHTSLKAKFFKFLQDKRRPINSLKDYPKFGKLFKKFNTPLPSAASVECIFSAAGDVLTANGNRLEDANFEKISLLK